MKIYRTFFIIAFSLLSFTFLYSSFEDVLRKTKGGCFYKKSHQKKVVFIKNKESSTRFFMGEQFYPETNAWKEQCRIMRQDGHLAPYCIIDKPEVSFLDFFAISPNYSNLVIGYYNNPAQLEIEVYSFGEGGSLLQPSPFILKATLPKEHFCQELLKGIAISNDENKVAYLHEKNNEFSDEVETSVTVFDFSSNELITQKILCRKLSYPQYEFISFLFNDDSTHVGLYYKKSQGSCFDEGESNLLNECKIIDLKNYRCETVTEHVGASLC
jgi:hypothetical protein